jgi:hypothetical protein
LPYINILVFLSQLFVARKVAKAPGTREKQSAFSLFKNCKQYLSVKKALPQTTCRSNTGERATRLSRNNSIAKNTAQTIPLLFLCLNGCLLCFSTVPVFLGITSAMPIAKGNFDSAGAFCCFLAAKKQM